jgi:adenylosuccinate lyase
MNKFSGLVMSQRVLLALTQAGVSREDSYKMVQRNAMKVWEHGKDFKTELLADKDVLKALTAEEIEDKFDMGYHTKHVDTIFRRVFGSSSNSSTALTVVQGDQTGNTKLAGTLKKLFSKVTPK